MASIFKQQYTTTDKKTGKKIKKKSSHWYIDYKDADGTRKRVKGFNDKTATAQLAEKLEKEAELVESGIVDRFKEHRSNALSKHLEDFRQNLIDKGNTSKHAKQVYTRARKVIEGCKFIYWQDITASHIERYLAELRKDKIIEYQEKNLYTGQLETKTKTKQGIRSMALTNQLTRNLQKMFTLDTTNRH